MQICFLMVVLALLSVAFAAPTTQGVQLLHQASSADGLGTYSFSFDQSDGQERSEAGEVTNAGKDNESITVNGSYTWTSPEGAVRIVSYKADENGFQPTIEEGQADAAPPAVIAALLGVKD